MGSMKYFVPRMEAEPFCFTSVTKVQVATSLVWMKGLFRGVFRTGSGLYRMEADQALNCDEP